MNLKRVFGALLTIAGIVGLIYAAVILMRTGFGGQDVRAMSIAGILGLVFFIAGIGLVKGTKDVPT